MRRGGGVVELVNCVRESPTATTVPSATAACVGKGVRTIHTPPLICPEDDSHRAEVGVAAVGVPSAAFLYSLFTNKVA